MIEYHKIDAPFMRDKSGAMLHGKWCRQEFEYLANNQWEFTEKVDGTNIRLIFTGPEAEWEIRGRTNNAQIPPALLIVLDDLCHKISPEVVKVMRERDISVLTVYGEGYGPKINGGGNYGDQPAFVAFDVRVGDFWLTRKAVDDFCAVVGLDSVPVLGYGSLHEGFKIVSDGLDSRWGSFEAEGIVAVTTVPLFNRMGNRVITKIKHRDFRVS